MSEADHPQRSPDHSTLRCLCEVAFITKPPMELIVPCCRAVPQAPAGAACHCARTTAQRDLVDKASVRRGECKDDRTQPNLDRWSPGKGVLDVGEAKEEAPKLRIQPCFDLPSGSSVNFVGRLARGLSNPLL